MAPFCPHSRRPKDNYLGDSRCKVMPPFPQPDLGDGFFPDPLDPCMPSPSSSPTPSNLVVGNPSTRSEPNYSVVDTSQAFDFPNCCALETSNLDASDVSFVPSSATCFWTTRPTAAKSSPASHISNDYVRSGPSLATSTHLDVWSHPHQWKSTQSMTQCSSTWNGYTSATSTSTGSSFTQSACGGPFQVSTNTRSDFLFPQCVPHSPYYETHLNVNIDDISKWNISEDVPCLPQPRTYSSPASCLRRGTKEHVAQKRPQEAGLSQTAAGYTVSQKGQKGISSSMERDLHYSLQDNDSMVPVPTRETDMSSTVPIKHELRFSGTPPDVTHRSRNHYRRRRRGCIDGSGAPNVKFRESNVHEGSSDSTHSGTQLSVREFNRRISTCARRRDLTGALQALAQLDTCPAVERNLFTYNAIINALVMCSQFDRANQLWGEMLASGIHPNLVTYNTMLKSCFTGTENDVERAFALVEEMEKNCIPADRVTLNSLINACVASGRVDDARKVYERMRDRNIDPDDFTFTTLAKAGAAQNDIEMLDALLVHQLKHHTWVQHQRTVPSRPSSSKACSNSRRQSKASSGFGSPTTNSPSRESSAISPVAYNAIADAYIRCGHPVRAIELLSRMRDPSGQVLEKSIMKDFIPVAPDVQTYNVKLKALREAGSPCQEAFHAVAEMNDLGLESDHITLLTLADLCCRRGDMNLAAGVLRIATNADLEQLRQGEGEWRSFKSNGFRRNTEPPTSHINSDTAVEARKSRQSVMQPRNAKANVSLFNALIRGYSSLDPPNTDAAVSLYAEMRMFVNIHGFAFYAPDAVTYTMLVDSFARIGDADGAEKIICEMEASGPQAVSVVAYNALLKANRSNGSRKAFEILDRIKNRGLNPDVVTYNTICDILSNEENGIELAEKLVKEMPKYSVRPDLLTFNTLLKGAARSKGYNNSSGAALNSAYHWLRELKRCGLRPDEFTYQSMVSACAAAGDASRALEFFRCVEDERAKRVASSNTGRSFSTGNLTQMWQRPTKESNDSTQPSENCQGPTLIDVGHVSRASTSINDDLMTLGTKDALERLDSATESVTSHQKSNNTIGSPSSSNSDDWMLLAHPAAYIALMRAFLSSGRDDGVARVLKLRDEMIQRGLCLGRAGYTAVADAYAELGDFEQVEVTLREMVEKDTDHSKCTLSPVHHCIRMKALCNANRVDDAIAIISDVENPDAAIFNTLIFACVKLKDRDRMITVLRAMERAGVEPDSITARALGSLMRSLALTFRSFDARFRSGIAKFAIAVDDSSSHAPKGDVVDS